MMLSREELWRLGDPRADPEPEHHEYHAAEQRHAPAPSKHLLLAQAKGSQRDGAARHEQADWWTHLRKGSVAAPMLLFTVFDGKQYRAGPFAAQRHSLHESQRDEQDGRERAGLDRKSVV